MVAVREYYLPMLDGVHLQKHVNTSWRRGLREGFLSFIPSLHLEKAKIRCWLSLNVYNYSSSMWISGGTSVYLYPVQMSSKPGALVVQVGAYDVIVAHDAPELAWSGHRGEVGWGDCVGHYAAVCCAWSHGDPAHKRPQLGHLQAASWSAVERVLERHVLVRELSPLSTLPCVMFSPLFS